MSDAMTDIRNNKKLRDQLAIRDAEIAELKAWNSELVKHQDTLADRCDQLREQVAMLREFMPYVAISGYNIEQKYLEALAATKHYDRS